MPEDDVERERLARRWALVAAHRERLLRLARSRSASAADAEDAVHETMLRSVLFENLDEERIGPFLTSVALRVCADNYRADGKADRLHERLGNALVDDESPEEVVCDREEARAVADVVALLPHRQQTVVEARSEGMSCQQVAHRLGLSYTAVESAIARARAAVRTRVEICLDATALAGARIAHALRAVPTEIPGTSAIAVGGLFSILAATPLPAAAGISPAPNEVRLVTVHDGSEAASAPAPAAVAGGATGQAGAVLGTVAAQPPKKPHPTPSTVATAGTVTVQEEPTGYTTQERVEHCVDYGVNLDPRNLQCNFPPGHSPSPSPGRP